MTLVNNLITGLFDTRNYHRRGNGEGLTPEFIGLQEGSNLIVALICLAIALMLVLVLRHRQSSHFKALFRLGTACTGALGLSFVLQAVVYVYPVYRLLAAVLIVTALLGIIVVYEFGRSLPRILALRSPDELEHEVAVRTAQLAQANEALESANRHKNEFLALLAHELRGPLSPMQNAVNLLQRRLAADDQASDLLKLVSRQISYLVHLLGDLRDIARISRGVLVLQQEVVLLSQVMERAQEAMRPQMNERQHQFVVTYPPEPIKLAIDPARIQQVLVNLLANSAKYTPNGGVITLRAEVREEKSAVIGVEDTGIGINPALLPRIFDLYVQGTESADWAEGGLGIGLSLSKQIIDLHNGTIVAHSDGEGKGCRFEVKLPTVGSETPLTEQAKPLYGTGRNLRILIVDDNHDAADSLALLLEEYGHTVAAVYVGEAAIAAVREGPPFDVVICDIGLPKMSGLELAPILKKITQATLVAVSGYGQAEDISRALAAGFDFYRIKPVGAEELIDVLNQV